MTRLFTHTQGDGPELYLVHGWGMNQALWEPLLEALGAGYHVTRVDLPGHGRSPCGDGRVDLVVRALLEAAPARAVWVGWSLGAQLALLAARQSPRRVEGLVAVAGTPCFLRRNDWPCGLEPQVLEGFARELQRDPRATLEHFLRLQMRGAQDPRTGVRALRRSLDAAPLPRPAALVAGLKGLRELDLRSQLAALDCPSHWLFGQRDTLVSLETAKALASMGLSTEVVPGAGHALLLSHPRRLAASLERLR